MLTVVLAAGVIGMCIGGFVAGHCVALSARDQIAEANRARDRAIALVEGEWDDVAPHQISAMVHAAGRVS